MHLNKTQTIAVIIAAVFHIVGAVGIVFTSYSSWFIQSTWLNLIVTTTLLIITQISLEFNTKKALIHFFLFVASASVIGFLSEVIGVNTSLLFGNYSYGNNMGIKLCNVPLIIGLQWFTTIYCCGSIMSFVENWAAKKIEQMEGNQGGKKIYNSIFFIIDASILAVSFDYFLEPAAIKLNYWQWVNGTIPVFNYISWFIISAVILILFKLLSFNKLNVFALHLFIIQSLFFAAIKCLM